VAYRARGLTPGCYGSHKTRPGYGAQVQGLDALVAGLSRIPLVAEPGTAWNYSIGYDVLAAVLERATGKPFCDLLRERITAPLDMVSTGFQVPTSDASRLTTLYGRTGDDTYIVDDAKTSDFLRPPFLVAGGGGLVSTARDMVRFAETLLANGRHADHRIAKRETVDQAIDLFSMPKDPVPPRLSQRVSGPALLSAVGASSTMLHVDRSTGTFAIFLAQLNRTGSPEEATRFRPELLAAIDADRSSRSGRNRAKPGHP
jgi:CubicO group peptidase (beta-lactamase class C family)